MNATKLFERKSLILLFAALVVNFLMKLWKWDEPIETDIMMYCMGGHTFHIGKLLYADLWDQKPPMAHIIYGLVEVFFGYGKGEIRGVNLIFSSILILESWILTVSFLKSWTARIAMMALITIGYLPNINYEVNQPNTELLINTFLGFSTLMLLGDTKGSWNRVLFGISCALATFIKHHAVIPCTMMALAYFMIRKDQPIQKRLSYLFPFVLITSALWFGLFGFYYLSGHFDDIWQSLIMSNVTYNSDFSLTIRQIFEIQNFIFLLLAILGPALWILSGREEACRNTALCTLGLGIGCYLMLAIPGKWFAHYYQLMFFPIYLSMVLTLKISAEHNGFILGKSIFACIAALCVYNIYTYTIYSGEQISILKYKGAWFRNTEIAAPQIAELLKEDEWFFEWGQDVGLFVYTNKWPHTRLNAYFPFVFGKVQPFVYPVFFHDVTKDPPSMVVFPQPQIGMIAPNINDPILHWIASNYFTLPTLFGNQSHLICCKIGSKLDNRLPSDISRKPMIKSIVADK